MKIIFFLNYVKIVKINIFKFKKKKIRLQNIDNMKKRVMIKHSGNILNIHATFYLLQVNLMSLT